jgi:type I restriction enzyme S subunit
MTLVSDSDVPLEFVFQSLNNPDKWHKRGSAQPFLSKKDTMEMTISVPKSNLNEFGNVTRRIYELKETLEKQNAKLREARDILLPKLMNGQIEV